RLSDTGVAVWSEPQRIALDGGGGVRMFVCSDPDGTQVELVEGDDTRLSHVVIGCADIDRSRRYYTDIIGLSRQRSLRAERQSGTVLGIDGDVELHAELLVDPATGFMVELVEWLHPSATPGRSRRANELG